MQKVVCKYCGDEHECTRMTHAERAKKRWAATRAQLEAAGVSDKKVAAIVRDLEKETARIEGTVEQKDRVAAEFLKRAEKKK